MNNKYILGLDGGGTYTRAAIVNTNGILLSYVEIEGGTCNRKSVNPKESVSNAINEAAKKADCDLKNIAGITAGIAGYDDENDYLEWVRELTDIDGLKCPVQSVNDSVIAQKGAFLSKSGIIAISGTGSNIFGITETGNHISNYDFHHYAPTAARFLSYDSVYKIIAGETNQTDDNLIGIVLKHFEVDSLSDLAKLGSEGFIKDFKQRSQFFGSLAPSVTGAAMRGSQLAVQVCNKAVEDILTGVRIIGACFEAEPIPVALIGSVANSTYIKNKIKEILDTKENNKKYQLVEPALPPVLGAVIMAMQFNGIDLDSQILLNLQKGVEVLRQKNT